MSDLQPKSIEIDTPPDSIEPNSTPTAKSRPAIIKPIDSPKSPAMSKKIITTLITALIITSAGVGTGFGMSRVFSFKSPAVTKTNDQIAAKGLQVGDVIGSSNADSFKDTAEGVLVKGGINGEGSHHLLRPGGPSQSVYLTSSAIDLDKLDGHKVKVWGETFAAQKAGWLMDIGRAEILELNAQKPFEEAQE